MKGVNVRNALLIVISLSVDLSANAKDWDNIPVPADAGEGYVWKIQSLSDDFNYEANANEKGSEFFTRWDEGFINAWTGPGMTIFSGDHASITNGMLNLTTSRKSGTENVFTGAIHSNETVLYPLYLEARVKITNLTLANAFWLLSADSTQEIDVIESYGSDRAGQEWFDGRMHLSHHVFIREPFQDYQPKDQGSWIVHDSGTWRDAYHRIGAYWIDPWNLEYYIDGKLVRKVTGEDVIDPLGYTDGTGLSKPMHVIFDVEQQDWREAAGIKATDEELADSSKNTFMIDWVRFYKPVKEESVIDISSWTDGDTITVEFADFADTNKEGAAIESDTTIGFNKAGDNVNFNTLGDWGDYLVEFPESGHYRVEYLIASETEKGLGITLSVDGVVSSNDTFIGTGDWGDFQTITSEQPLYIETAGTKTIRIQSSGASVWQWNGDEFSFTHVINPNVEPVPEEPVPEEPVPEEPVPEEPVPEEPVPEEPEPEESTPDEQAPTVPEAENSSGGTSTLSWLTLMVIVLIVRKNILVKNNVL